MPFLGVRLRALGRGTLPRGPAGFTSSCEHSGGVRSRAEPAGTRPAYKLVNKNRSGSLGNAVVGSVWYQKHVELMSSCSGHVGPGDACQPDSLAGLDPNEQPTLEPRRSTRCSG